MRDSDGVPAHGAVAGRTRADHQQSRGCRSIRQDRRNRTPDSPLPHLEIGMRRLHNRVGRSQDRVPRLPADWFTGRLRGRFGGHCAAAELPDRLRGHMQQRQRKGMSGGEVCSPPDTAECGIRPVDPHNDGRLACSCAHPWTISR